jgi:hypothetical protein
VTISWFRHQKQGEEVCWFALETTEWIKTVSGHTSTSGGLLRCEASRTRVSQFCLKTGEGAMTGGARGIITEVMWK